MSNLSKKDWKRIIRMGYTDVKGPEGIATEGLFRGGEQIVSNKLGKNKYIPCNIEEIIVAGLEKLKDRIIQLDTEDEIAEKIRRALKNKEGYSLISLGDGEIMVLAHDIFISTDEIRENDRLFLHKQNITTNLEEFPFLNTGINLPNHRIRDDLAKNVFDANTVGIPTTRLPAYQCLFNDLVHYYQWPLDKMSLTNSVIGYRLNNTSIYHEILANHKVLLIGNRMAEGKNYFNHLGYNSIVATLPVPGFNSYPSVIEEAKKYEYDVALVAAGVASNMICVHLSKQNKVAIDIGKLIDEYISGIKTIRTV